ncbi:hypothetical protein A0J61_04995, partial [Choanephora cucurbitarum]
LTLGVEDLSDKLMSYRRSAVSEAANGSKLSDTHLLALNYIYCFDLKMNFLEEIGAMHHLKELRNILLVSYGYKPCQDSLQLLCNKVLQLMVVGEKKKANETILLELLDANNNDDEQKTLMLNVLAAFAKKVETYSAATEQSYVESTLVPWLENYFNSISNTKWASCHGLLEPLAKQPALLEAFDSSAITTSSSTATATKRSRACGVSSWLSLSPDYLLKVSVGCQDFDVFLCEFKKPGATPSQLVPDKAKLANMMKIMLDRLVLLGVSAPVVCGLIDDGQYTATYKMVIQDDGCYAFVQLASFRGIRCMSDLVMIPTIMSFYDQLKAIILDTKSKIEIAMLKEVLPGPLVLPVVPCSWLRPSFEYPRVVDTEKRQKTPQ